MKIALAAATAVMTLGLSACGSGSQVSPRTRDIVTARVNALTQQFLLATQARNAETAGALLSDAGDALFASDGTIFATAAEFRSQMEAGFAMVEEQTFEPGSISIIVMSPTAAVITGNGVFTITGTDGLTIEGLQAYTLVWRKTGDDWYIVQAHFSTHPVTVNSN